LRGLEPPISIPKKALQGGCRLEPATIRSVVFKTLQNQPAEAGWFCQVRLQIDA
jgi:hypothetical protein